MNTPERIRGEEPADLPLILQKLLDQIEALQAADAGHPSQRSWRPNTATYGDGDQDGHPSLHPRPA
jgi:hypothetical protein